jgi:hypothetical protein
MAVPDTPAAAKSANPMSHLMPFSFLDDETPASAGTTVQFRS